MLLEPFTIQKPRLSGLPRLIGDERRLMQVLVNLTKNAMKYTKNGTITM